MVGYVDELSIPHSVTTIDAQRAVFLAGPTCARQEVLGEAYNPDQMGRILASVQGRTDAVLPAWLMPEPTNPHDPNAVIVWVLGGRVGYMPRELAAHWHSVLGRLFTRYGAHVACQATVEAPSAVNGGEYGVVLWLPALPALPSHPHQQPPPSQPLPLAPPVPHAAPAPVGGVVPAAPASWDYDAFVAAAVERAAPAPAAASGQEIVADPAKPPPTPEELEQLRADIAQARTELKVARTEP